MRYTNKNWQNQKGKTDNFITIVDNINTTQQLLEQTDKNINKDIKI